MADVVMDAVIDKFGTDVTTYACDQHSFRVIANVSVGTTFYNWVFGFQGRVKIKSPDIVKRAYKSMVRDAAESIDLL